MLISRQNPIPELLRFISEWVPDLSPKHRVAPECIPAFVPPPLRAIYELAGSYPVPFAEQWRPPHWNLSLFGPQDQLLPPDQLKVKEDRFRFIHENQGVWSCGTLTDQEDPPVFSNSCAYEYGDDEFRVVCSSLSHFLTTFCLRELVFGSKNLFCVDSEVSAPADLVNDVLVDVWIDGFYVYENPTDSFYLCCDGLLVLNTGGFWLAFNDNRFLSLINSTDNKIRRIRPR